ncbi:T-cell immunomodulatory protein [Leptopilina boulardi]|uniref:T-cell immunomodulatory protein n=1 Tax=Leptopilina boulardi TaxID=63433 RepID=UPI0021F679BA|nr:T-cell immunomodulatory protein [Leptopilina boulardi]
MRIFNCIICFSIFLTSINCSDITTAVFGNVLDGMPAAFGDFNSDELTDVFVIRDNGRTVQIMLASDQEPLLRLSKNLSCSFRNEQITNVVPGDFDGDVFMDVLVTTLNENDHLTYVYILWGSNGDWSCSNISNPIIKIKGQPLSIDYNHDMIIDLFGIDSDNKRMFWTFNKNRTQPTAIEMNNADSHKLSEISSPHSNAFLDINNDFHPDLILTTKKNFEVWLGNKSEGFYFDHKINYPYNFSKDHFPGHIGQSLYIDAESIGRIDLVLPLCFDPLCKNSTIMIYSDEWYDLHINFKDTNNIMWGFVPEKKGMYTETITLRGGDFNMDGYPDLLATLGSNSQHSRTFLLLNVHCSNCGKFKRTFEVHWNALSPFYNNSIMAVFYDFYQDGVLDVIFVTNDNVKKEYRTAAFKNSLDYDANFVKVMVLTGLTNSKYPISPGTLGKKKRTYGTNLPGPSIAYKTTTQDGNPRNGKAAQLPQSAYYSLNLPYTTFGLGRTPNFVDSLKIGVNGESREWFQIIPNSQMVVIPNPISEPSRWKAQLFVTPSKLILLSAAALTGTCGLITAIILILYWKERREDKIEKLQEAHRFHFDAM